MSGSRCRRRLSQAPARALQIWQLDVLHEVIRTQLAVQYHVDLRQSGTQDVCIVVHTASHGAEDWPAAALCVPLSSAFCAAQVGV